MGLHEPVQWVALGVFAGALVLLVCLSVVLANVYRERPLLLHAAATTLGVLALQLYVGGQRDVAQAALVLLLAVAGLQLRDLTHHVGALRGLRPWLLGICIAVLPALALAMGAMGWELWLWPPALAAAGGMSLLMLLRAWRQSRPWIWWLAAGLAALAAAAGEAAWHGADMGRGTEVLTLGGWLALWSALVFLATLWRSRLFGENRVRSDARNRQDPLTGLATPLVLAERVNAARLMMKRYRHPSVLLLVHIEDLSRLATELGSEVAGSAVVEAAARIRGAMGDGDVAARLGPVRIAVLAEGASVPEATANIASRILVAGLKEPLRMALTEFLRFRIVLCAVPVEDVPAATLLQRLSSRMDEQLVAGGERRIHALAPEELRR
ncbi:regulator protein (GGDEF domain), membrane protein-like protein [Ramlibacter tataouinensis TTB310]|uniref:Regulator protein (GGDEF domain), membrane protein-like protein n=2 Tax=Ramlibacter tataouinensis TaxID=94132 RepID=F5Y2W5_RAMTT|nr:regulator protein (GGDEF domain), membrane protein-like protein [Ramlibacter tataouinensis TTB310]